MVFGGGEESCKQSLGAELEDEEREEDDDEAEPPGQACAEAAQERVAHVVDGVAGVVGAGEDDVPEEPAADGAEDGDAVGDGF